MQSLKRRVVAIVGLSLVLISAALAQDAVKPAAPPVALTVPPETRVDEADGPRGNDPSGNAAPSWRNGYEPGVQKGTNTLPGIEKGVLIQDLVKYPGARVQNAGEAWRQVRNRWIVPYGGALLLITCLALALYYWRKGPITVHEPATGRVIERFTYFERATHWVNAIAFCLLALSGIVIAFGKFFLLPIVGATLFGWLTYALKTLHNFVGPAFAVSLVLMFLVYVRDNLPRWDDVKWLMKGGGLFSGAHVPSHRFNAGEKIVFWGGVLLLGSIVVGSGFVLDKIVPFVDYTRGTMQIAHMVHAGATVLMMAMIAAHSYLGTVGMQGAYSAMRSGYVDENWAKEHHEYWYRDVKAGKIPAQRTPPDRPRRPASQH